MTAYSECAVECDEVKWVGVDIAGWFVSCECEDLDCKLDSDMIWEVGSESSQRLCDELTLRVDRSQLREDIHDEAYTSGRYDLLFLELLRELQHCVKELLDEVL